MIVNIHSGSRYSLHTQPLNYKCLSLFIEYIKFTIEAKIILFSLKKTFSTFFPFLKLFYKKSGDTHLSDTTKTTLAQMDAELAALLQKYTEKHPRVMQLREQIKRYRSGEQSVSPTSEIEYGRLSREVDVNNKIYGMLREKLEE